MKIRYAIAVNIGGKPLCTMAEFHLTGYNYSYDCILSQIVQNGAN